MRRTWIFISPVLFAVAGVLLTYPLVSTIINNKYHSDIETAYTAAIESADSDELAQQREAARQYNALLAGSILTGRALTPPVAYEDLLTRGGAMAYIDIPKIGVYLPVQHGTDVQTLERAVGHIIGTSLPVGGSSTHAVLSAHSGMASSKLFSDIDQLAEGDTFYIHVLGDTLAYQVDNIATVLPTDTSLLQIEGGKDLVTLVTCTPFGVNTHRLLVRGHRVPYTPEQKAEAAETQKAASSWTRHYLSGLAIGLGAVAVAGGGYYLIRRRKRHA